MYVGIGSDSKIDVKQLPITITRNFGLYFPEKGYFNSDPLPNEWIELIQENYS